MKKFIFLLLFIFSTIHAQQNGLDQSIDSIWSLTTDVPKNTSPEALGKERLSLIPPTPARKIPGDRAILVPIEQTEGSLNASPNDAQAYILYNRATIAFQNKNYEQYSNLYRELIRRYPDSSYTPYALYVLSLDESDVRRKIRIFLTIKERFPNFPHQQLILDSLGDLYYLLGSYEAAEEVLAQSDSYYSAYLRANISLENQLPNRAISLVRQALQKAPDNESAYKIYLLYAEALFNIKSYANSTTILQKAAELRPWAYDNGSSILLNAGKAFYHNNQYPESLYAFSLLRLRFAGTTEARLADQYITTLNQLGTVQMTTVPWIAENFNTIIQQQPIKHLTPPQAPSISDIQEMNNLPQGAVPEPDLDYMAIVPPMPLPTPSQSTYSVYLPVSNLPPAEIDIVRLTNIVIQTLTNTIAQTFTNRIFVVETNTFSNNLVFVDHQFTTNISTNVVQVWETNNVVSYEPVIMWKTNYRDVNITNLVTNIVDQVVTNEYITYIPLQHTNYNFINRPHDLTNIIYRDITNRYLEYGLNNTTNWRESIVRKEFVEIVPSWKTTYNTIDTNELVTNVIREIVTNQRLELVPQWISNLRTNDAYKLVNNIITNTRLRVAPRWITNYQIIQTNLRDVIITNIVNDIQTQTNFENVVITNVQNLIQTNLRDVIITNVRNILQTNLQNIVVTNQINVIQTNLNDTVITNVRNILQTNLQNIVVTNQINVIQTNLNDTVITNVLDVVRTNLHDVIVTNRAVHIQTNSQDEIFTNIMQYIQTNVQNVILTNTQNYIQTNRQNDIVTNIIASISTNYYEQISTNIIEISPMNYYTNISTNLMPETLTNFRAPAGEIQFAPMQIMDALSFIDEEDQRAFIEEPLYAGPVQEEQIKLVSQQVMRLESLASRMAEKSAGIAGEYGFTDNKGYVIRIAELKDLSVANIVLKDIEKLNLGVPVGIFYRDSRYFVEMRAIKDKDLADHIYRQLYQLGYHDVQIFEQFEVVEYKE